MQLQQDIMFDRNFDRENTFLYSCHENFLLFDNLDNRKKEMPAKEPFYNSSFYHAFFVTKGTLKAIVDGVKIEVKENEYFVVMPCVTVEFLNSEATFFAFIIRAHIVLNLYDKIGTPYSQRTGLFCVYHHRFNDKVTKEFKHIYLLMKREAQRPDYIYKELAIGEYVYIYILNVLSIINSFEEVEYHAKSKKRTIYLAFQEMLHDNFVEHRDVKYYADRLGISAKYLSSITLYYTGFPASVVIDNYVVFMIKVQLYEGELNLKKISELYNFQSQSFFGRYFKRVTGFSPREFVNRYNKRLFLYKD